MKTIINGYLQEDLVNADIDLVDIEIIKYFQQFSTSRNMKHIQKDNELYFWLSYQKLIDDLPIVNIKSKRTIARRFDDLVDKGIFEKTIVNNNLKNFTYFKLTDLHQSWLENMDIKFKQPIKEKEDEKDSIPYKQIIDYLNKVTNKNYRNVNGHHKHIKARWNEGFTLNDFFKVIDVKSNDWINDTKYNQYLRPSTLFGNKMDQYLNQKGVNNENNKGYESILEAKD